MKTVNLIVCVAFIFFMSCSNDETTRNSELLYNNTNYELVRGFFNEVPNVIAKNQQAKSSNFHFFLTNGELTNTGNTCYFSESTSHIVSFKLPAETGTFTNINGVLHKDFKMGDSCNYFTDSKTLAMSTISVEKNGNIYTFEFSGSNLSGYFTGELKPTIVNSIAGGI